jgi:hypothetical protein
MRAFGMPEEMISKDH